MTEPIELTICNLAQMLADKRISSRELTLQCLRRIDETRSLNAFLHVDADNALLQADAADARRNNRGNIGILDGIPLALKDNLMMRHRPITCASRLLDGYQAPYDSTVVTKLKEAGAVLLGKLNMDEFAMGSSTEHSSLGPTLNPWNKDYVPGGSSGGSAVAVAAGSAIGTLGTDTGGSIRLPAAWTGIVGMKPTYGLVSRFGVIAFASSLDQVGPMTKDVTDCATLLQAIAGYDPKDSTSYQAEADNYCSELENGVRGMKIGIPKDYFVEGLNAEIRAAIDLVMETYKQCGAELIEISLPHCEYTIASYYLIATAEASSNLARFDGVLFGKRVEDMGDDLQQMYRKTRGQGFGDEVKRRIMLGTFVLSSGYYDAYYLKAQKVRTLVKRDFEGAFNQVDAILTPTSATTAFKLNEMNTTPLEMYLSDVFTVGANLAGLPALSIPCGFSQKGLPIGFQLVGKIWSEKKLLRMARAYEREHFWSKRIPRL